MKSRGKNTGQEEGCGRGKGKGKGEGKRVERCKSRWCRRSSVSFAPYVDRAQLTDVDLVSALANGGFDGRGASARRRTERVALVKGV